MLAVGVVGACSGIGAVNGSTSTPAASAATESGAATGALATAAGSGTAASAGGVIRDSVAPTSVASPGSSGAPTSASPPSTAPTPPAPTPPAPTPPGSTASTPSWSAALTTSAAPSGVFTLALAGDINFAGQTAPLLAADPDTALRAAADQLAGADLTMVNLETAITTGGSAAPKEFHFRAPPTALDALAAGGVDIATMANNHAVDYSDAGLTDTLAAISRSPIPVLGIGADADRAYAPYVTSVNGVSVAFLAASAVRDHTLAAHTVTDSTPGIASAFSDRLPVAVSAAASENDVVIVYLHWGIEFQQCPSDTQQRLADRLAAAGATAVVGTHAHLLQGAGWRSDGVYVAYGLGNYYWWLSLGNWQDDAGVLTLTVDRGGVIGAEFLPTRLGDQGVPRVMTGDYRDEVMARWESDRQCAGLLAAPPGS